MKKLLATKPQGLAADPDERVFPLTVVKLPNYSTVVTGSQSVNEETEKLPPFN